MAALKFTETHNLVVFLSKPEESDGFEQIVDFLNAHTINYALTVNPTVYTSCIEQFWTTVKEKTVNGELPRLLLKTNLVALWPLLSSVLPQTKKFNFSKYIFDNMVKNLEGRVKSLLYPRFVQVSINQQLEDMSHHKDIYVTPLHTKKIFGNMKRKGKGFFGTVTPLFATMMVQAPEDMGEGSATPTDPHPTPTTTQPSTSNPKKK
ncbi:hypothetical protein Tco_0235938 [Tanacetum coccineum]